MRPTIPQSSVRTGLLGLVTSTSWKSPTAPPESISENGTAASANTLLLIDGPLRGFEHTETHVIEQRLLDVIEHGL